MEYLWALILGFIVALVLAFGIGANDVANSFGTSVGSKVLTIVQACIIATIFETLGAILIGGQVSNTIRKGIVDVDIYKGTEKYLVSGEISALLGSAVWLIMATFLKLPVSASHSIVGSTLGFSLVLKGHIGIHWEKLGYIVISWFASPLLSGIISGTIFILIRRFVLTKKDSLKAGLKVLPYIYAITCGVNLFSIFHNGPHVFRFNQIPTYGAIILTIGTSLFIGLGVQFLMVPRYKRRLSEPVLAHTLLKKEKKQPKFFLPQATSFTKINIDKDFEAVAMPNTTETNNVYHNGHLMQHPYGLDEEVSRYNPTIINGGLLSADHMSQIFPVDADNIPKIHIVPARPLIVIEKEPLYEVEDETADNPQQSFSKAGVIVGETDNLHSFESPIFEPTLTLPHERERKLSDADKMFLEYMMPGSKPRFEHPNGSPGSKSHDFLRFGSINFGNLGHHNPLRGHSPIKKRKPEDRHASFSGTLNPKEYDKNRQKAQRASHDDILSTSIKDSEGDTGKPSLNNDGAIFCPTKVQGLENLIDTYNLKDKPSQVLNTPQLVPKIKSFLDGQPAPKSSAVSLPNKVVQIPSMPISTFNGNSNADKMRETERQIFISHSKKKYKIGGFAKLFTSNKPIPLQNDSLTMPDSVLSFTPKLIKLSDDNCISPNTAMDQSSRYSEKAVTVNEGVLQGAETTPLDHHHLDQEGNPKRGVSKLFAFLQILTGAFGAFAHGGNDVSNSIGPLIALYEICKTGSVESNEQPPLWILFFGGMGISLGLWLFGKRVMETMGKDLTVITPVSGFTIEIGAAMTVLLASNMGIPISTTHCKVGSIVFVGYLRSKKSVDWKLFGNIVAAWIITVPASVALSAAFTAGLRHIV